MAASPDHSAPAGDFVVQPRITGYRQLNQREADLINHAKALGEQFDAFIKDVNRHIDKQLSSAEDFAEIKRLEEAEPRKWLTQGRHELQTAVMKIIRSIAQPTTF
jgi:hypothetical protein